MKAIKQMIILTVAIFASVFTFGQLTAGVKSATQATVNATTIVKTGSVTTQATKSTVNSTANKTAAVKATTKRVVDAKSKQTLHTANEAKNDVKQSSDVKASTITSASSQSGADVKNQNGNNSTQAEINSDNSADGSASMQVHGDKVIDKANTTTANTTTSAKNTGSAGLHKIKTVKTKVKNNVKSDADAASKTKVSVDAKTETKATVGKQ